ncbi:hypothetical protein M5W63_04405 [Bacillus pumilus]|uniref:hypothetical protein n=1 Tax=Bacillus pumilus TaxID=1408 RepID=UPI0022830C27|nr:hypothetical protein [Bacillus pumilus]MCY9671758.1 hypothetical protein [Bacillus pumilus]
MEWFVLINTVISSVLGIIVLVIGGRINSKIEKQKNDYSLYNEKKHIHYSEAYRLLKIAEGNNLDMHKITSSLILDDYNNEDLEKYLKEFMPKGQILKVLKLWENEEFQVAKEKIKHYKLNYDEKIAYQRIIEASNYCHEHELYFKNDTFKLLLVYISELFEFCYSKQLGKSITDETRKFLLEELKRIKIHMQNDLSIVGSNKTKKK